MKWLAIVAVLLPLLVACSTPEEVQEEDQRLYLMRQCYDQGGVYFEYEATSAGAHVWCVSPEGEPIAVDVSEGDD